MTVTTAHPVSTTQLLGAYCRVEAQILWRIRTPLIFVVAVPVLLSVLLGSGASGQNADGLYRGPLGLAVMFSFMVVNYAGLALYDEHVDRTAVRQALYRPPALVFIGGKLLPPVALSLVQLLGFTLFAIAAEEMPIGADTLLLLPTYALLVTFGAAFGVVLHNVCPGPQAFQALTYLILICFAAVGGAIVRSDSLPLSSRVIGYATPHHWALRATDEVAAGAPDLSVVASSCAVLLVMAVLVTIVAHRTFAYEVSKDPAL